ncbi:hypothetical protein ATO12_11190 [Aquimarina atlantica]|uniref:Uncharacterized protein n=1 Tax=Aquimarina atlantica TaxID=1317122 RepID=A0A023BXE8_9FLAO|nr:hypothetical protein ATO12_11190 [Aquimarina atlantica]
MEISREFLIDFLNIGTFIQFVTALISTIYFKKYNNTILKYFSFILWYTFINEIVGILIVDYYSRFNAIIYNIYHVINFFFLFLIYREFINSNRLKKSIMFFILIYIMSFIINGFYENYLKEFQSIPYIIAASLMITTIILYFSELLNSEKVLNTNKNLLFWISVGLLIFFVGNIPFRIVRNYYTDLEGITILFLINIILTIIMNLCFIIGFIWSDSRQQY